jgi:serine/threonine protein phosphatase PrpC
MTEKSLTFHRLLRELERATLVLHCDGVNEAFSTPKVAEMIRNPNFVTAADKVEYIGRGALLGDSRDNVSVMVIPL